MTKSLEISSEGQRGWFGRRQRIRSRTQLGAQDRSLFTRLAEAITRFIGTPKFILWITMLIVVWTVANLALNTQIGTHNPWDSYPLILLNLAFSTQVSYTTSLIMLAQNRQGDRDQVITGRDRQQAACTLADTEYLTREIVTPRLAVSELAARDSMRLELYDLLTDLESRGAIPPTNNSDVDIQLYHAAIWCGAALYLRQIHKALVRISGCKPEISPGISVCLVTLVSGRLSIHPK